MTVTFKDTKASRLFPKKVHEILMNLGFEPLGSKIFQLLSKEMDDVLGIRIGEGTPLQEGVYARKESPKGFALLLLLPRESLLSLDSAKEGSIEVFGAKEAVDELANRIQQAISKSKLGEVYNGSPAHKEKKSLIKTLKSTRKAKSLEKISGQMISPFLNPILYRKLLEFRRTSERVGAIGSEDLMKLFDLTQDELETLSVSGILSKVYTVKCTKCHRILGGVYESEKMAEEIISRELTRCDGCFQKLNKSTARIGLAYSVSELGSECIKGFWLEAYVLALLKDAGVPDETLKPCVDFEGYELDDVFVDSEKLFVCECKDTNVGRSDVDLLMMQASRLGADYALLVSTRLVSPDIYRAYGTTEEKPASRMRYETPQLVIIHGRPEEIGSLVERGIDKLRKDHEKAELRKLMRTIETSFLSPRISTSYSIFDTYETLQRNMRRLKDYTG